ncbi:MAG: hypothetical protein ABW228_04240 [Thermoleophilaceae bacterium]
MAMVAVLAAVAATSPVSARAAACGEAQHYMPVDRDVSTPPPLAIGDSVMLGAVEPLRRQGFEIDARECRQMSEGLRVLGARARAGTLPSAVAVGLGTNWTVTLDQIRRALRILGRERVLVLVTPRELGGASSTDQDAIRAAGRRWPGRVRVADWVAHSGGHRDWFWSDGLHLRARGARAFARLISRTLGANAAPPASPPPPEAPGGGAPAP